MAGNQVEWLIDNNEAYEVLVAAVRDARESIWISQLAFDTDCRVYARDTVGPDGDPGVETILDSVLTTIVKRRVIVKILLNSTLLLDTRRPLLRFLAATEVDAGLVEVRGVSRFPQLLHAKMVIIDQQRAFLIGSPFVNGYWDTPSHAPVDDCRPHRELGGRPIHDVSIGVRGPAVHDLSETFARLWNGACHQGSKHAVTLKSRSLGRRTPECGIEVVTTEPSARRSGDPGSRETLDALLDGIQRASSLVYIEHQYLSSRPVVDALRRSLERERSLKIIIVLNQNPDVTAYRRWQNARLVDSGLLAHPRVGVFALWSAATLTGSATDINQVFVHSKVVTIDDEWAMVGSANLDGASLDSYGHDFSSRLARHVFRDVRNIDVSMVFTIRESVGGPSPIRELRERLWREHLGSKSLQEARRDPDTQLAEWRALASRNVASLNCLARGLPDPLDGSFILPYSTSPTPRAQLADAGVHQAAGINLRFDPGWLEVNFSPNWIRNVFL